MKVFNNENFPIYGISGVIYRRRAGTVDFDFNGLWIVCRREVLRESFAVSYAQEEKSRKKGEEYSRNCPKTIKQKEALLREWVGLVMLCTYNRIAVQTSKEEEKEDLLQPRTFWWGLPHCIHYQCKVGILLSKWLVIVDCIFGVLHFTGAQSVGHEVVTYEDVVKLMPDANRRRPIVLIGWFCLKKFILPMHGALVSVIYERVQLLYM